MPETLQCGEEILRPPCSTTSASQKENYPKEAKAKEQGER
jgi:hypothetical protein